MENCTACGTMIDLRGKHISCEGCKATFYCSSRCAGDHYEQFHDDTVCAAIVNNNRDGLLDYFYTKGDIDSDELSDYEESTCDAAHVATAVNHSHGTMIGDREYRLDAFKRRNEKRQTAASNVDQKIKNARRRRDRMNRRKKEEAEEVAMDGLGRY